MSTKAKAYENPVIAALEACAQRRWRAAGPGVPVTLTEIDEIARTVDIVDAAAAKIESQDYSGIANGLAAQSLALDIIFDQFVRRSAVGENLYHSDMGMAFRAQMQCRVTYKNLMAVKDQRASQDLSNRTIENGKIPA